MQFKVILFHRQPTEIRVYRSNEIIPLGNFLKVWRFWCFFFLSVCLICCRFVFKVWMDGTNVRFEMELMERMGCLFTFNCSSLVLRLGIVFATTVIWGVSG